MKNALLLGFVLATIFFASLCAMQSRRSSNQQAQVTVLRNDLMEKAQQLEALETSKQRAEQQRQELMTQVYQLAAQVNARSAPGSMGSNSMARRPVQDRSIAGDAQEGGLGTMLSKIMQDPDTRELVRATQRTMVEQLYSPLIRKMALTPEQATQFKSLLTDNMMNAAQKMSSAPAGTSASEVFASASADQKAFDDQIRQFLGDEHYAQYKEYQDSAAERMQLTAFKQQMGEENQLSEQQTTALISAMKEAQKNLAGNIASGMNPADQTGGGFPGVLSEEKMNDLLQAQQTVSQQVYENARSILSSSQLDAFGSFQTNQLQMMRVGMSMARKMFGPAGPGQTTPGAESAR